MRRIIKFLCLLVSVLILLPFAVACGSDGDSILIEGYDFKVKFGDVEISPTTINSAPQKGEAALYTREYKRDSAYSITIGEEQKGRVALTIVRLDEDGEISYKVAKKHDSDIANIEIPVNGFVITAPASKLSLDQVNETERVEVTGYDNAILSHEDHNYATFSPTGKASISSRRINILNPINEIKENKIYFVNNLLESNITVDVKNTAVTLEKSGGTTYLVKDISQVSNVAIPKEGAAVLIFTGEYNIAYAAHYFGNTERINVTMLSLANSFSDVPSIKTANGIVEFDKSRINVSNVEEDGVYLYDSTFEAAITPEISKKRLDVVIVENVVVKVSDESTRTLIPNGNGFVVTMVGDDVVSSAEYKIGDRVESGLIEYLDLESSYVKIGSSFFEIDGVNTLRNKEGMAVLYSSDFGSYTNTNEYGTEIIIKNGKVDAVAYSTGNSLIPSDGYVLSIHQDNKDAFNINKIRIGDSVSLGLSGPDYNITELEVDGFNDARGENMLIVYRDQLTSGTNEYGYEVAVDSDGIAIDDGYGGDIEIPEGGFALSAHGTKKDALAKAYTIGEKIVLDTKASSITIIRTPDLKIKAAEHGLEVVSDKLEEAKKAFYNIEYKNIQEQVVAVQAMLDEAEAAFKAYDFEKAFNNAQSIVKTCENLQYAMIESKGAENRAIWYRSTDKCDTDVERVIKRLKNLNINTVYLETWYEGYCIGNKVEVEGINLKRNADFDVLEAFVRIGHENGIEVHAWVQNFFVGYYYENGPAYYNPVFGQEEFHDKYVMDKAGNKHFYYTANGNYWYFLNPNDRECRDLVLSIYKEIINKYDIDGLHLDYVRYPELNLLADGEYDFGYNQDIIDGFAKKTGITTDPRTLEAGTPEHDKWIQYRCDIITSFVGEVYDLVQSENKDLWLSAALYPDIELFKTTIMQDIKTFAEKEYFDEIFSMSYGVDNKYVLTTVNSYIETVKNHSFYSSGIAAFLETTQENFAYQLTEPEMAGADGLAIFSLANINVNTYENQIIKGAFKSPSVQVNRFSETAAAQMDYISNKADNISTICSILTADNIAFIKNECADIKSLCDELDYATASSSAKIAWANKALKAISSAKSAIISECGNNAETNAIIVEFEDLEYWLTMSIKRINK